MSQSQSSNVSTLSTSKTFEEAVVIEKTAPSNPEGKVTMNTDIKSVADLKEKAPHVYRATLVGIATSICMGMSRRQHRINKMIREGS